MNDLRDDLAEQYRSGRYWRNRMDLMYYAYIDYMIRTIGRDAKTLIDIGTANCPYLEWFDWIPERVSFDRATPYASKSVRGLQGDFLDHDFGDQRFDIVTCLQVLEHVPQPKRFARKLLSIGDRVVVSVPYRWPSRAVSDHLHDPVTYQKLTRWMGRRANYHQVVQEPFRGVVGARLIAIYDTDLTNFYARKDYKDRVRRNRFAVEES